MHDSEVGNKDIHKFTNMYKSKTKIHVVSFDEEHDGGNPSEDYIPIQEILRPLMLSMTFQGIYFQKDDYDRKRSVLQKIFSARTFCVLTLFMSSLNVIRYIPAFWVGIDYVSDILASRVIMFAWLLQCFLNRAIFLRASWKKNNLPTFFKEFNDIMTDEIANCLCINTKCNQSKRFVVRAVVIAWAVILLNNSFLYYLSFSNVHGQFDVAVVNPFSTRYLVTKVIFMLINTFEVSAWLLPIIFQITVFKLLRFHFKIFKSKLIKITKEEGQNALINLRNLRLRHSRLCKLVELLDKDIKLFMAVSFVSNLFLACFTMYQMITSKDLPVMSYIIFTSWFMSSVCLVTFVSSGAAILHEEAHSPLEELYCMNTDGVTPEQLAELSLFLCKLKGPPVGFTAFGMIFITKELILTMAGIFVTYFVLLLQFHV